MNDESGHHHFQDLPNHADFENKIFTSQKWTLNEDNKLLQLMANQDSRTIYSSLSKYITDKDINSLQARYNILIKWMRMNPNIDLKNAPSRGARCLNRGNLAVNFNRAIDHLRVEHMQSELREKKDRIIKLQSSEQDIEHAILQYFVREKMNAKFSN